MLRRRTTRRAVLRTALTTGAVAALAACGCLCPQLRCPAEPTAGAAEAGAPAAAEEQFTVEILVDWSDQYMQFANDTANVAPLEKYPGMTINVVPMDYSYAGREAPHLQGSRCHARHFPGGAPIPFPSWWSTISADHSTITWTIGAPG